MEERVQHTVTEGNEMNFNTVLGYLDICKRITQTPTHNFFFRLKIHRFVRS